MPMPGGIIKCRIAGFIYRGSLLTTAPASRLSVALVSDLFLLGWSWSIAIPCLSVDSEKVKEDDYRRPLGV